MLKLYLPFLLFPGCLPGTFSSTLGISLSQFLAPVQTKSENRYQPNLKKSLFNLIKKKMVASK